MRVFCVGGDSDEETEETEDGEGGGVGYCCRAEENAGMLWEP